MDIVKIIYENGSYDFKDASNPKIALVGLFLATNVGCRYSEKIPFRDWVLANKENPNSEFTYGIGGNATFLEEKENGFIYLALEFERVTSESNSVKMSRQQFVQLLDDWHEKVCKPKAKEVVVKDVNDQFIIETKN